MTGHPEAAEVEGDALFAMGFFVLLLPVLVIAYAIVALVMGWASLLEAGVAILVVFTQVMLTGWAEQRPRRQWAAAIGWGPVMMLAKLIAQLSRLPGVAGVATFLAVSMQFWYSAVVLAVVIVLVP